MVGVFIISLFMLVALGLVVYLAVSGMITVAIAVVAVIITVGVCVGVVKIVQSLKSQKQESQKS